MRTILVGLLLIGLVNSATAARWTGQSGEDAAAFTSTVTLVGKIDDRFIKGTFRCRGPGCPMRRGNIRFTCGSFGGTIRNETTRCVLLSHSCDSSLSTSPMLFSCSGRPLVEVGYLYFQRVK